MLDFYFNKPIEFEKLKEDENITLSFDEDYSRLLIELNWNGEHYVIWTYGLGVLEHAEGHSTGLPFYLYTKYGVLFGDGAMQEWYCLNDSLDKLGYKMTPGEMTAIYDYLCLGEMKAMLPDGHPIHKQLDSELDAAKPDYEKAMDDTGLATIRRRQREEWEKRAKLQKEINNWDGNDDLPF